MSKEAPLENGVMFLGGGESSDAHHITAPDPSGNGAKSAMKAALAVADLLPSDIDYINAHGTATIKNDEMEALAINSVFGNNTPLSSSKYLTGHTLGAAGAIEAGICWLLLRGRGNITLPFNKCTHRNKLADVNVIEQASTVKLNYCLSNSFAFGGNNASLILGTHNE
jgi:3-oxoacyl-[acyl-carrier-protein] synthase-1